MNSQFCDCFIEMANFQPACNKFQTLCSHQISLTLSNKNEKNTSLLEALKLIKDSEAKSRRNLPGQLFSALFLLCRE